jgi:hypothetical protein
MRRKSVEGCVQCFECGELARCRCKEKQSNNVYRKVHNLPNLRNKCARNSGTILYLKMKLEHEAQCNEVQVDQMT